MSDHVAVGSRGTGLRELNTLMAELDRQHPGLIEAVKSYCGVPDAALSALPLEEPYKGAHGLVRNLLARLPFPDRLPAPEIVIEQNGDLGLDWDLSREAT